MPLNEENMSQFLADFQKYTYKELSLKYGICQKTINKYREIAGLSKKKGRKPMVLNFQKVDERE